MFNEEINGDLQLFQQLCAGCYGRLFYTKQQKNDIPKTLSISRINHSRVMSISEWHMASWFFLHFSTFQRIWFEWIDNKVNLPNSKVNPNFNRFSLVVFHFSVYFKSVYTFLIGHKFLYIHQFKIDTSMQCFYYINISVWSQIWNEIKISRRFISIFLTWGPSRACVQAGSPLYHVTNMNTRTWGSPLFFCVNKRYWEGC